MLRFFLMAVMMMMTISGTEQESFKAMIERQNRDYCEAYNAGQLEKLLTFFTPGHSRRTRSRSVASRPTVARRGLHEAAAARPEADVAARRGVRRHDVRLRRVEPDAARARRETTPRPRILHEHVRKGGRWKMEGHVQHIQC